MRQFTSDVLTLTVRYCVRLSIATGVFVLGFYLGADFTC